MHPHSQKQVLEQVLLDSIQDFCFQRSVALGILNDQRSQPIGIGSGVCIKSEGHYFIATAGHVITDAKKCSSIFIVHTDDANSKAAQTHLPIECAYYQTEPDVGFLLLDEVVARQIGKVFIGEENLAFYANLPVDHDYWTVFGFPWDLLVESNAESQPVVKVEGLRISTIKRSSDPYIDGHIYLHYPEDAGFIDIHGAPISTLPHPGGMSGGGIWVSSIPQRNLERKDGDIGLWSPNDIKLVAIDAAWNKSKGYLKGVDIREWVKLVKTHFPNTFPSFEI